MILTQGVEETIGPRDEFEAAALGILGPASMLWLPENTDELTSTGVSRKARTITWDATVEERFTLLGRGYAQEFDGTDDEGDIPEPADNSLSYGDGAVDQPFSMGVLIYPDAVNEEETWLSKYDSGGTREWRFQQRPADFYPALELFDEASDDYIGAEDQTVLTISTWVLVVATYDGSGSAHGISIFKNALQVDDARIEEATPSDYVAMSNQATPVNIGCNLDGAAAMFFDGKMGLAFVTGKQLSADNNWQLKKLVNEFTDLTL